MGLLKNKCSVYSALFYANKCAFFQAHAFFRHVNWQDVLHRRLDPPFKPALVSVSFVFKRHGTGIPSSRCQLLHDDHIGKTV